MRETLIRAKAFFLRILYFVCPVYRFLHETCIIDEGDLTPSYGGYDGTDSQGFTECLICRKRSFFVT